jgi:hypothetical protein
MLRKIFYPLFFCLALNLHANLAEFNVVVNFSVPVSVTISASNLTYSFSQNEAKSLVNSASPSLVGTFDITIVSSTSTDFTVYTYAESKYINPSSKFQALSSSSETLPCNLLFYSNKNASGDLTSTELINLTTFIQHQGSNPQNTIQRTISVLLAPNQIAELKNKTYTMSLFFRVEGV